MADYRALPCGHYVPIGRYADDECPFCADYAEAFGQNALDELLGDPERPVVPHTRE